MAMITCLSGGVSMVCEELGVRARMHVESFKSGVGWDASLSARRASATACKLITRSRPSPDLPCSCAVAPASTRLIAIEPEISSLTRTNESRSPHCRRLPPPVPPARLSPGTASRRPRCRASRRKAGQGDELAHDEDRCRRQAAGNGARAAPAAAAVYASACSTAQLLLPVQEDEPDASGAAGGQRAAQGSAPSGQQQAAGERLRRRPEAAAGR